MVSIDVNTCRLSLIHLNTFVRLSVFRILVVMSLKDKEDDKADFHSGLKFICPASMKLELRIICIRSKRLFNLALFALST